MVTFLKKREPFYKRKEFLLPVALVLVASVLLFLFLNHKNTHNTPEEESLSTDALLPEGTRSEGISFKLTPDKKKKSGKHAVGTPFPDVQCSGHQGRIHSLIFFDDGKKLASASIDQSLRVWDIENLNDPKPLYRERMYQKITATALSPNQQMLAIGTTHFMNIFNLKLRKIILNHNNWESPVVSMSFSRDGKYLACSTQDGRIYLVAFDSYKKDKDGSLSLKSRYHDYYKIIHESNGHIVTALDFSQNHLAAISGGIVRLFSIKDNFKQVKEFGDFTVPVTSIAFDHSGTHLLAGSHDGMVKTYDEDGTFKKELLQLSGIPTGITFTPDDDLLFIAQRQRESGITASIYTFPDAELIGESREHKNRVSASAATLRDNKPIFASAGGEDNSIILWDDYADVLATITGTGSPIYAVGMPGTKDSTVINFGTHPGIENGSSIGELEYSLELKTFRVESGVVSEFLRSRKEKKHYRLERAPFPREGELAFSPTDVLNVYHQGKISATILRGPLNGQRHKCFTFVGESFIASGGEDGFLALYSLEGRQLGRLIGHKGDIIDLAATQDGSWLASASSDRTIRLWHFDRVSIPRNAIDTERLSSKLSKFIPEKSIRNNVMNGIGLFSLKYPAYNEPLKEYYVNSGSKYKSQMVFFPLPEREWIAWTPSGYFDASSRKSMAYFGYYFGLEFLPNERVFDLFFRPNVIRLALSNPKEYARQMDNSNYEKLKEILQDAQAPIVQFLSPEPGCTVTGPYADVKIKIKDIGGGIGDIRLYHNGKLISSEGVLRINKGEGDSNQNDENVITNKKFFMQVGDTEKTFSVRLVPGENEITCQAMNYKNTVGSGFKNLKFNSSQPEEPANLYILTMGMETFKNQKMNLRYTYIDALAVSETLKAMNKNSFDDIYVTTLMDPGKQRIMETIEKLANQMTPSDTFYMHISSHGALEGSIYYIIASDFDGKLGSQGTISTGELINFSRRIPALSQVFFIDTCHAGAADWAFSDVYQSRLNRFVSNSGMHLIAASTPKQYAFENFANLGHGLFSYFVIQGLQGFADIDFDGEITLSELSRFITWGVARATWGHQVPIISNFGNDFIIARTR